MTADAHPPGSGLDGSVALVTGAASGIGHAVAAALSREGARVAVLDVDTAGLEETAAAIRENGGEAVAVQVDVREAESVERAIGDAEDALGPLDVAVGVAGVLHVGEIVDFDDEAWRETFAVNADGTFHVLRGAARRMVPRRRGALVAVSSNSARVPRIGLGPYSASKAALTMLTRCLGLELAPHGIRCNVVSPGSTSSPMLEQVWDDGSAERRAIEGSPERFWTGIPLGRVAEPGDVADTVVFLASDRARHITMQDVVVDGGAALTS